MKKLLWSSLLGGLLLTVACTEQATNESGNTDSVPSDTTAIAADTARTITGVAIDGSRRSLYLKVQDDTLNFELPPDIEVSWDIGDTISIVVVPTPEGDSIATVVNDQA